MRWTVCLVTILLSGCQGLSVPDRPAENAMPIMPLWERYKQCLVSTNPQELLLVIDQFDQATHEGTEPPSWMRAWGHHVINQPLRLSVDPQALGAACTLRAAALLVGADRLAEARALYQRILSRDSNPSLRYYIDQAKWRLSSLSDSLPAVVAVRASRH
ncbi:MAG TPA: hypothetical protein VKB81_02835 [Nitrospira sp.]|nr:hypothetical protein [Nitrospira sp.]